MDQEQTSNGESQYVIDLDTIPQPELAGHGWLQQGIELTCRSCPFTHSTTPTLANGAPALLDYQYIGNDVNGKPQFQRITVKN